VASMEKSISSLGGFVIVPAHSRDFFRYNSHTYIFSGQLPAACLGSAIQGIDILENEGPALLARLFRTIQHVKAELQQMGFELIGENQPHPLILLKVGDVYTASAVSQFFFEEGIHILTVGFPVIPVARGALVRISLSAGHSDSQVEQLLATFRKLKSVLPSLQQHAAHAVIALNGGAASVPACTDET